MHEQEKPAFTEIVRRARELGPRDRRSFVAQQCKDDPDLASQVDAALYADEDSALYWDGEEIDAGLQELATRVGQRLGPYRLVRSLGVGGMGEVYLAERDDDEYQQQVAIKLVHTGALSAQVQTRLRLERQILATLKHPNIAQLLDGGTTPDGTPYLVMEYIDGLPIDIYCDRNKLSLEQRLALFCAICSAVHCAHQNLIVHRDLKPSNILVTADGAPKLLDFGIAKLLDERRVLRTMAVTHHDVRIMTPSHASPEQVRGETVTTASDIYVLGVLLYELLCGRRAFTLPSSGRLIDIERVICDVSPIAMSAAVARARRDEPGLMEDLAACRATTAVKLERQLRGDLDNIVLMALRKEPARRYAFAEQFAADVRHYMEGRPVLAARDSWTYRSGKFLKRHAFATATVSLIALMLLAFGIVSYLQAQNIARQRDMARAERSRAERVSGFLVDLFELSDPSKSRGNELKARELLDIGTRRIDSGLADQPSTRAMLLGTIGRVYDSLGLYNDAAAALEKALQARVQLYGPQHAEVAEALVSLSEVLIDQGKLDEAEKHLSDAALMRSRVLGADAVELAPILKLQGRLALERGDVTLAEKNLRASLALYEAHGLHEDPQTAEVLTELGSTLAYKYEDARAEAVFREALAIDRRALGEDHPLVAELLGNVADSLEGQRKYAEALPLFEQSLALKKRILGDEHPQTIDALENFGNFLRRKGDFAAAEQALQTSLQINRKIRGEQHAYVGYDHVNLGLLYYDQGNYAVAEREFRDGLKIYKEALPAEHVYVAGALIGLGRTLTREERVVEALPLLQKAIEVSTVTLGSDNAVTQTARAALGTALVKARRYEEAEPLLRSSQAAVNKTYGETATVSEEVREALVEVESQRASPTLAARPSP